MKCIELDQHGGGVVMFNPESLVLLRDCQPADHDDGCQAVVAGGKEDFTVHLVGSAKDVLQKLTEHIDKQNEEIQEAYKQQAASMRLAEPSSKTTEH